MERLQSKWKRQATAGGEAAEEQNEGFVSASRQPGPHLGLLSPKHEETHNPHSVLPQSLIYRVNFGLDLPGKTLSEIEQYELFNICAPKEEVSSSLR